MDNTVYTQRTCVACGKEFELRIPAGPYSTKWIVENCCFVCTVDALNLDLALAGATNYGKDALT